MEKVIGYIRVSTDIQVEEGYSLEAQRQDIERYCQLYGLELINIISDEGVSAGTLEREGLQKALIMLKTGVAEGLIVAKLDRFTRNVKDLGYLLEEYFTKYALMSVSDKIDTSTASGRLVLNIIVSVAQWEREAISERVKKGMEIKRDKGERIGGIPYGKRLKSDGFHTNRKDHPLYCLGCLNLEDNPDEQNIISTIKTMRQNNMTYEEIENRLENCYLYKNRHGKSFALSSIYKIANL